MTLLKLATDDMLENNKIITLENMRNMHIDQIVELYKDGYRLQPDQPLLVTLHPCSTISLFAVFIFGAGVGTFILSRLILSKLRE